MTVPFELRLGAEEALAGVPRARERMAALDTMADLRTLPARARVRWLMLSPAAREIVLLIAFYAVLALVAIVRARYEEEPA